MSKVEKILRAIKNDLLPVTAAGVAAGNHVFGGLVLDAVTLETVIAGSNNRQENPIYHGEIDTIQKFFALEERPAPQDCIFVASHDPCSMCISAIAWAGFREIWVLFGYEDVAKDFDMPVDLMMYKEVFCADVAKAENAFFSKYSIKREAAKEINSEELADEITALARAYGEFKVSDFDYPGM
mgnify:FL=1